MKGAREFSIPQVAEGVRKSIKYNRVVVEPQPSKYAFQDPPLSKYYLMIATWPSLPLNLWLTGNKPWIVNFLFSASG
jgi:hypothetical protein